MSPKMKDASEILRVWVDVVFDSDDIAHIYLNEHEITHMLAGDVLADLEQRAEEDAEEMRQMLKGGDDDTL